MYMPGECTCTRRGPQIPALVWICFVCLLDYMLPRCLISLRKTFAALDALILDRTTGRRRS